MTTLLIRAVAAAAVLTSATAAFAAQHAAPRMQDYTATYDVGPQGTQNLSGEPDRSRSQVYVIGHGVEWKTIVTPKSSY